VQLSAELIDEIAQFDVSTQATVIISGPDANGGTQVAVRIVPLPARAPWWTLTFIALAAVVIARARRKGTGVFSDSARRANGLLALATVPAVVLGWYSTETVVVLVGIAVATVAGFLLRRITADTKTVEV